MKLRSRLVDPVYLLLALVLCQGVSFSALSAGPPPCTLLIAYRVFDGISDPQANMAVLIVNNKVEQLTTGMLL